MSLFLVGLSVFLPWIYIPIAGPALGILQPFGIFLLVGTIVICALAAYALVRRVWALTIFVVVSARGFFACAYLGGSIFGITRLRNDHLLNDNIFAGALIQLFQPGPGLLLGTFAALCLACSASFIAIRQYASPAFSFTAMCSHLLSVIAAVMVGFGPWALRFESPPNTIAAAGKSEPISFAKAFEDAQRAEDAKEKRERLERVVKLGTTRKFGSVQITPVSLEYRRITGERGMFRPTKFRSDETLLVLTFEVKNISEGQVFTPSSWASVSDNFGNKLDDPFEHDFDVKIDGNENRRELKPGEKARIVLCRKPKIETSTSYQWEVHTRANNKEHVAADGELWIVNVSQSDITKLPENDHAQTDEGVSAEIEKAINPAIDQTVAMFRLEVTKRIAADKPQRDQTIGFLNDPEFSRAKRDDIRKLLDARQEAQANLEKDLRDWSAELYKSITAGLDAAEEVVGKRIPAQREMAKTRFDKLIDEELRRFKESVKVSVE
jgi:hypothetical protein